VGEKPSPDDATPVSDHSTMMNSDETSGSGRRLPDLRPPLLRPVPFGILIAVIAAFGLYLVLALPPNCDNVVLLHEAGRLLDGSRLYVDIKEVNPPLIIYLNVPVVLTSRLIGVSPSTVLPIFVLALIGCSLALCNRLRDCLPAGLGQVAVLIVASVLLVFAGPIFGEREHLMSALILPYAFAAATIADGGRVSRPLALFSGVMAGIGFSIKPFYVPAFLAVELYLAVRRGPGVWVRAQALAVWACFCSYGAVILLITPEYLPFAWSLREAYQGYHPHGNNQFELFSWIPKLLGVSIALATGLIRRTAKGWSDVLSLLGLLLTAGAIVQAKGFFYHWYPVLAVALALLFVSVSELALRFSRPARWANPTTGLSLLFPASCALAALFWSFVGSFAWDARLDRALRDYGRGKTVGALSSMSHALCIAERNGMKWASIPSSLLPVQSYYSSSEWRPGGYHEWDRMSESERRFLSQVVGDLERATPGLLLVDKQPPSPEMAGFDFLEYLGREPRFSRIEAEYRYLLDSERYRIYRLESDRREGQRTASFRP
jgi:hypothetical protein